MTDVASTTYQCLAADEATALIRGAAPVTIFDVRDLASYRRGHIAEAAHLSEDRNGAC